MAIDVNEVLLLFLVYVKHNQQTNYIQPLNLIFHYFQTFFSLNSENQPLKILVRPIRHNCCPPPPKMPNQPCPIPW